MPERPVPKTLPSVINKMDERLRQVERLTPRRDIKYEVTQILQDPDVAAETETCPSLLWTSTTAADSIANNTLTLIEFDEVTAIYGGLFSWNPSDPSKITYNGSTERFVDILARVEFLTSVGGGAQGLYELHWYKNGSLDHNMEMTLPWARQDIETFRFSRTMSPGDYIQIYARQTTGVAMSLSSATLQVKDGGCLSSLEVSPEGAWVLDGAHYWMSPDEPSYDITGDIDLRAAVALTDWTPGADPTPGVQDVGFIGKWGTAASRSYTWELSRDSEGGVSNRLFLAWSNDGTTTHGNISTVAPTVSDGAILATRGTLDVDNGAGGVDMKFYTKATTPGTALTDIESDSGWTQLGSTVTEAGTSSIFSGSGSLLGGGLSPGFNLMNGSLYALVVKNGINGTTVANPDFYNANAETFTDALGNTWTKLTA